MANWNNGRIALCQDISDGVGNALIRHFNCTVIVVKLSTRDGVRVLSTKSTLKWGVCSLSLSPVKAENRPTCASVLSGRTTFQKWGLERLSPRLIDFSTSRCQWELLPIGRPCLAAMRLTYRKAWVTLSVGFWTSAVLLRLRSLSFDISLVSLHSYSEAVYLVSYNKTAKF